MKKLSNTEGELKKSVAYKKMRVYLSCQQILFVRLLVNIDLVVSSSKRMLTL